MSVVLNTVLMYYTYRSSKCHYSGGSRGGARRTRVPPLFWVKIEEMTEGKMADRARKSRPAPPPPLAQALDPPLH